MRTLSIATVAAAAITLGLALTAPAVAAAQSEEIPSQPSPVLGIKDPQTGVYHPLSTFVPEVTTAPVTGTLTVTLHITLKTAVPAGDKVACSAIVEAIYAGTLGANVYTEQASSYATVSGATATCVLTIPHSWQFPATTTTDNQTLTGSYTAEIINPAATASTEPLVTRSSSSAFYSLTGANVFATAPTTFSVNVTL